jgi:prepilin-type N-terminal cleavage/methylation domain-containing protein/prepilin-type processing-associated H-X9-DG protein
MDGGTSAMINAHLCWIESNGHERTCGRVVVRPAFSLIELLVVVAIVGVLTAIILPAVQASRGAARRTQCVNNLRQLAIAAQTFHASREHFPPGLHQYLATSAPRYRGTSMFTRLLPYLEQGTLLTDWDFNEPLHNTLGGEQSRSATVIGLLVCPSDIIVQNPIPVGDRYFGLTSYGGNGGSRSYFPDWATADGIFHTTGPASRPKAHQLPVNLGMIRDGASNTILLGERSHADENFESFVALGWTDSLRHLGRWAAIGGHKRIADVTMSAFAPLNYRLPVDAARRQSANPPLGGSRDFEVYEDRRFCAFGSEHSGGANFAYADASVRFLDESLNHELLKALCTRAGGEPH